MARHLKTLAATPIVALALVAAAGCGGSSPTAATTTTTTTTSAATTPSGSAATTAFRACLAKAGVKLPSGFGNGQPPQGGTPPSGGGQPPQGGGPPSFSAKQRKAFTACQSKLPAGARRGGFPNAGQNNPALAKYTNCLRKHGVTFGGSSNQSAFKKASAACAKYAPTAGG